jgi:cytidylate kinase
MAIITISRGCFSHGQEIAEKVAARLGYDCISREVLLEAAKLFNVSERKLIKSLHDAPTVLERISNGKMEYLADIKAALLKYARKDNIVYHGHAGHLLLTEIPKVLKVRILAEKEDRIAFLKQQQNMSREQALLNIENEDKHRTNWTRYLYKTDINDPSLYDIVINIGSLTIDTACELICRAAKSGAFLMTDNSKQALDDAAISSHISAALQSICDAQVSVANGEVQVKIAAQKRRKTGHLSPALQNHLGLTYQEDLIGQVNKISYDIPGVKKVFCSVDPPYYV